MLLTACLLLASMASPPVRFVTQSDFAVIDAAMTDMRLNGPGERWRKGGYQTLEVQALTAVYTGGWAGVYEGLGLSETLFMEVRKRAVAQSRIPHSLLNYRPSDSEIVFVTKSFEQVEWPLPTDEWPASFTLPTYLDNAETAFLLAWFPWGMHSGITSYKLQRKESEWFVVAKNSNVYP